MGSGFVPNDLLGVRMGLMAAILAETSAYAAFVGEEVAELGAAGMYFDGIDVRDLEASEDEDARAWPDAFVVWANDDDVSYVNTLAEGATFKFKGAVMLTIEKTTPEQFRRDTPGAYNWIRGHMSAMLLEMIPLFGHNSERQGVERFWVVEGPYRCPENDERDYCSMTVAFDLRT